ncbi:hypothetical protein N7470_008661 [Penicillium chermesinum]|nr:hypothetical protein N7470_008661 [Penicillium chermesinum]
MPPKAGTRRTAAGASGDADSSQNTPEAHSTPSQSATPGPSGRPVQRLQSLKKRPASGSIPATGRPSALSGEAPKPALKFKPKAVARKTKEEREAIEKLEAERNSERLKEAAAIQRGRGGNTRGRGSFRGRGGAAGLAGSGPLGSGAGSGFGGAKRGRGGGAGGQGGFGGKRGAPRGGFGDSARYDDSSDDDLRVSIDNINLESEDSDSDVAGVKGKRPSRRKIATNNGLRPARVPRREHEERIVSVNMESSSSKAAEIREKAHAENQAIEVDDKSSSEEKEATEPRVKEEPQDDDTAMEDVPQDDDFLPATPVRVRRKTSDPKQQAKGKESTQQPVEPPPPKRDPRDLLRTREEIEEYDRHLEDLEHFRNLLSIRVTEKAPNSAGRPAPQSTEAGAEPAAEEQRPESMAIDGEGEGENEEQEGTEPKINEHLLGQLFLMQFPPMTPTLTIPGETSKPHLDPEVKTEDGGFQSTSSHPTKANASQIITASTNWSLPAGRVGKLNVHKSGRVTMDWGGISFELDRAAKVDFAQEALIMSTPEAVEPGQPARDTAKQTAWSMGAALWEIHCDA